MRSVDFLIAGRAIAGISIGILSMGCPLCASCARLSALGSAAPESGLSLATDLSEIAPYKYRGAFTAIAQQMYVLMHVPLSASELIVLGLQDWIRVHASLPTLCQHSQTLV